MIGSIRWNFIFALIGGLLTFLNSITNNIFTTSLMKSGLSFLAFFLAAFIFRWLLGTMVGLKGSPDFTSLKGDAHKGTRLDLTTPNEDNELQNLLKPDGRPEEEKNETFSPLTPPKLATKKNVETMEPEELANALRRISED
jgi:hypothetical protein